VNTKAFRDELEWVARFVEKKATIPVLCGVKIVGTADGLTLTATDLETGGITSVASSGSDISAVVNARQMLKYLKKVTDPEVTLSSNGSNLTIEHEDANCRIDGMTVESYPELPAVPAVRFTLGGLTDAIPRVTFAISKEESRYALQGALLDIGPNAASLVSTDGHRLSIAPVSTDYVDKLKVLIPKFALSELHRLGKDSATSATDENHIWFVVGERTIISRKLTGNFPDYERVIPHNPPNHATVDAAALKRHGERVALFADDRSHAVVLRLLDNRLTITSAISDHGKASASVATTWERPEWIGGFNWEYICDFLKLSGPSVEMLFADMQVNEQTGERYNDKAVTLVSGDWRYVVMPMRI
jgi:DNA polymerase-3 subunit beta